MVKSGAIEIIFKSNEPLQRHQLTRPFNQQKKAGKVGLPQLAGNSERAHWISNPPEHTTLRSLLNEQLALLHYM